MKNPSKQRGSFLLTVMIVMLIMVFTGLFVMETARLKEVTVSNEQSTVEMYQVAYSELENQLTVLEANPTHFTVALGGPWGLPVIGNPTGCTAAGDICQEVKLKYIEDAPPPPGYSLERNISRVFELESVAYINRANGARSSQTLGVIYVDTIPGS